MNTLKMKLREQFHLQSIKKNKILRNKFNKNSYLYTEKYKTLLKYIKEDGKIPPHSGIRRLVKMVILTKLIYRFNAILSKSLPKQKLQAKPKCIGNVKDENNQDNFEKEEQSSKSHTFQFQNLPPSCSNHNSVVLA